MSSLANFKKVEKIRLAFPDQNFEPDVDGVIEVSKEILFDVCVYLHETEGLYFDQLACITGLDDRVKNNCYDVVYNLYSIPYEEAITLKVKAEENDPSVPSLVKIWKAADWLEREVYDMYGISFSNHPDLRRILMPANWEGYPLRKDYKTQEYYHGIKVDY